ncbi:MAG: dephospho-CoA kinase [Chloroflexi bacterium]|nr:dephospho-CoA kinase [Chloroflexota bacterium]
MTAQGGAAARDRTTAGRPGRGRTHPGSRPLRIGLTGPIGCGKSTVARVLGRAGAVVIDADVIARDVTAPGEPALDRVVERFGAGFLRPDGTLDRAALGRAVFADPAALADLERIIHPAVRRVIEATFAEAERDGAVAVVVEAIKLVEGGLAATCDEVWLVACSTAAQRARLRRRGLTAAEIAQRIAAQAGIADRVRPVATRTIDTTGRREATAAVIREALADALAGRAREGAAPPAVRQEPPE